ncbi:MAG: choline dehydrogenase-like flavoprotein [Myxococcota bacterium]|jgi:choline dehydrogenase-like flavoprotein
MSGAIIKGRTVTADVEVSCDVCIIGSGAGGAVLAAGLAEAGLDVVILEAGGHHTRADWAALREDLSYPMLYQERGSRATADLAISVLQGRTLGGGTVVNWTTCFRTPERVLERWQSVHGLEGWSTEAFAPHWAAVEERLSIGRWHEELVNANNDVLRRGCAALGWDWSVLRRNVRGCANSGYCGLGCPVDAKQSMHLTYLPDAVAAGARIYADCRADRLEVVGDRVVAVHASLLEGTTDRESGHRLVVRPKVVVSSAGAINGPALLLRSGLHEGGVGERTWLHPVVGMMGQYADRVSPWFGAPQSVSSHEFVDRGPDAVGFFLEAAPLHPMLSALAFSGMGEAQGELMSHLAHVSSVIALHVDGWVQGDVGGTVTLRSDGRPSLDYPVTSQLTEAFAASHHAMAQVHLAAGADRVASTHVDPVILRTEADLAQLKSAPYGAFEHNIFTAHQMGGCVAGPDPSTSVVDPQLRHHRVPNLFVVDGSVFPTALGVNPSQTIYGIAHRARRVVGEAV